MGQGGKTVREGAPVFFCPVSSKKVSSPRERKGLRAPSAIGRYMAVTYFIAYAYALRQKKGRLN